MGKITRECGHRLQESVKNNVDKILRNIQVKKTNLELMQPRCVCNNEVNYNEGEKTNKFIS